MVEKFRRLPKALYFLFAGTAITRLGAFVFPYLTIYLTQARGYGVDQVGLILSVGSVGLLLGNLAGGWLTDHWRRKTTLVLALLLNACGFAALAGHYESGWAYAGFLLLGYFGSGMFAPAANTVVADLAPVEVRPFAYTVNYVCINLGMGLGPLIGGFLATYSYHWIFVGDVTTSLVCAGLIAVGVSTSVPQTRSTTARESSRSRTLMVWHRHPLVFAFCLAFFFMIAPLMGLEYAVPLLVKTVFLESLTYVGVVYTINAACILSLSFLVERLIRGRNEFLMMATAGLLWATGLVILLTGFSLIALLCCTVVWTIGEIIASITVPSFIARHVAPEVKGRFMALNDVVRSLAGIVAPIGLGFLWARHGAVVVTAVLAALPAAGVVCYLVMLLVTAQPRRAFVVRSIGVES